MKPAVWFTNFVERVLLLQFSRAQRVAARVAFDGVEPCELPANEREIARRLFGNVDTVPPEARAAFVGIFGARSGKTFFFAGLYCLWRALTADLSTLAAGELAVALIVAPDLRLARQVIRYALGAAKGCDSIAPLIESEAADGFTLRRPDGYLVSIEALPATRGGSALRGRSLVCAVLDEAAFFRDESSVINDIELFKAVAPRVLPGGLVVIITTAFAEVGLSYDEFQRNFGHPITALAAHAPTELMRDDDPRILAMVARERLRDPENARHEFDALFRTSGSTLVFSASHVDASFAHELPESNQISFYQPIGVLDMSGGGATSGDATCAGIVQVIQVPEIYTTRASEVVWSHPEAIVNEHGVFQGFRDVFRRQVKDKTGQWQWVDAEPIHPRRLYLALREVVIIPGGFWGKIDGTELMRPIGELFKRWGARVCFADRFESGLAANELAKYGVRLQLNKWSNAEKHAAVLRIKRLLSDSSLMLTPCEELRAELKNYQQKAMPGGLFHYAAKGKNHDDTVALLINAAVAEINGNLAGSELFSRGGRHEVDDA